MAELNESNNLLLLQYVDGTLARLTIDGESHDYDISSVQGLDVSDAGGNDHIEVGGEVALPTLLRGGAGDDTLLGGAGADLTVTEVNGATVTVKPINAGDELSTETNFYEGGVILSGVSAFSIIASSGNASENTITLAAQPTALEAQVTLKDDDDSIIPATLPNFSLLTDPVKDRFRVAYIQVQPLPLVFNPNRFVPFQLNARSTEPVFNGSHDVFGTDSFWAHRVIAAYQGRPVGTGTEGGDADPDAKSTNGQTPNDSRNRSAIYLECIRDRLATFGILTTSNLADATDAVVAHEIGHGPHIGHTREGIMRSDAYISDDPSRRGPPFLRAFAPESIRVFRSTQNWNKPPG